MLRELLISSPLLLAGIGAFYYLHRQSNPSPAQPNRPSEAEQDELIQQLINNMQHELRDTYNGQSDEEDEEEQEEEEEEGEEADFQFDEHDLNDPETAEEFRRRINPTPAQLAAEAAANAGTAASSSRRNRTVGTKKSKSLAKKDRIRAYNEYMRQEAESERLRQAEYEEEYADLIAEAKLGREQREASAEAQIQQRRLEKREQEEKTKQELSQLKEKLQNALKSNGSVRLQNDTERELASDIKEGVIVGNGDWLLLIDNKLRTKIATSIKNSGRISFSDLAANV